MILSFWFFWVDLNRVRSKNSNFNPQWLSSFPTQSTRDYPFSSMFSIPLSRINWPEEHGFILRNSTELHPPACLFISVPHAMDYCSSAGCHQMRHKTLVPFLFYSIFALTVEGLYYFHVNSMIFFLILCDWHHYHDG